MSSDKIAMVKIDTIAAYSDGLAAQGSRLRPKIGTVLYSSNELGELSQWMCQDDSTIKIVVAITV